MFNKIQQNIHNAFYGFYASLWWLIRDISPQQSLKFLLFTGFWINKVTTFISEKISRIWTKAKILNVQFLSVVAGTWKENWNIDCICKIWDLVWGNIKYIYPLHWAISLLQKTFAVVYLQMYHGVLKNTKLAFFIGVGVAIVKFFVVYFDFLYAESAEILAPELNSSPFLLNFDCV